MVSRVDVEAKSKGRHSFGTTTLPLPEHHENTFNKSFSEDNSVVQIGAVSMGTLSTDDDTRNNHGVKKKIESTSEDIESLEPSGTFAHFVEARVVEDALAGFAKRERQAAQADVFFDEDKERRSFLLRGCFCVMLVLVIVFATTTGVAVAKKTSPEATYGSGMTLLFTPETSAQPSPETSAQHSPEPSAQPSLMPTSKPLNNTFCEEAHPLVVGQTVSGSFKGAIQTMVVHCYAKSPSASFALDSPVRWYRYRGEGFPVALRADEFVDIHVRLTCSSDSECPRNILYPNSGSANPVIWEAKQGTDYLILVATSSGKEELYENFTLTIETNDSMATAFGPLTPGINTFAGGSTVGTRVASEIPACGSASSPTGPGVWYSVMGNGKTIKASTFGSPTGLDTQISVLSADKLCIDGNDDSSFGNSHVAWSSNDGEIYFVLVHGKDGAEGTFMLQVTTEGSALADADFCANAKLLEVGSTEEVHLSQATVDPDIRNCTDISDYVIGDPMSYDVIGNFYTFKGTGKSVQIRTHYPSTSHHTQPF